MKIETGFRKLYLRNFWWVDLSVVQNYDIILSHSRLFPGKV
jgi:hypothetical protein